MQGELPPIVQNAMDEQSVVFYVENLIRECEQDNRRRQWLLDADNNYNLLIGVQRETAPPEGVIPLVINRIRPALTAMVAAQTNDPYAIKFNPNETGDLPTYFIDNRKVADPNAFLELGFSPEMVQGMMAGQPLPYPVGRSLAMTPVGQEVIISINDRAVADVVEQIYHTVARRAGDQAVVVENTFNKNTFGCAFTLVEWDGPRQCPVFTNCHHKQVHIDPLATSITRASYAVYSYTLSAGEALRRFPKFRQKILLAARTGNINENLFSDSDLIASQTFYRPMVRVRVAWIRDQRFALDPMDAQDQGLVNATSSTSNVIPPTPVNDGTVSADPILSVDQTTHGYTLADGTPTDPLDQNWPYRLGLRQLLIVDDVLADDSECLWPTIPLCHNMSAPVPYSPYGEGLPQRLKWLQEAINAIASDLRTHADYYGAPIVSVMESLGNMLEKELGTGFSILGRKIKVPDEYYMQLRGQVCAITEPPETPQYLVQLLQMFLDMIDKEAGNSDVLQGEAKAKWSGSLVKSLQQAAITVLQFDSIFTEQYIEQMAELVRFGICYFLSQQQWAKMVSKYPDYVLAHIFERAQLLDWSVQAEVASGSKALKNDDQQQALLNRQAGVASLKTTIEKTSDQPEVELLRMKEEMQEAAMAASVQQANQPQPSGGGRPAGPKG